MTPEQTCKPQHCTTRAAAPNRADDFLSAGAKVKAEIYGEHPSGLTALLPHEDWGNMIVAHPADGDEAMTGRKSTTTNHLAQERIPRLHSRCVVVSLFCFLWRFFQFR